MSWEAVGAISEAVGVIAIFVSLVYLAVQIRQNTEQSARNVIATRLAALESNIDSGNRLRELLIINPDLLLILIKGYKGLSNLDGLEKTRFGLILRNVFSSIQGAHIRHLTIRDENDSVSASLKTLDQILANPGVREWLAENDPDWRDEFREFVDARLAILVEEEPPE